jgi:hypothetical protein
VNNLNRPPSVVLCSASACGCRPPPPNINSSPAFNP